MNYEPIAFTVLAVYMTCMLLDISFDLKPSTSELLQTIGVLCVLILVILAFCVTFTA